MIHFQVIEFIQLVIRTIIRIRICTRICTRIRIRIRIRIHTRIPILVYIQLHTLTTCSDGMVVVYLPISVL